MKKLFVGPFVNSMALVTCAFILATGLSAQAFATEMTFNQAWQVLQEQSETLKASRESVTQAKHGLEGTRSLYLPQLTLTGSYLYLDDDVELSAQQVLDSMPAGSTISALMQQIATGMGLSATGLSSGLTSTISDRDVVSSSLILLWPLYTGGRITAARDVAKASLREAELMREMALRDQFEELSTRYFGVIMAKQLVEARKEAESSLKIHLEHATHLLQNGQIAEVERLQAEASYDKARVDRITSEEDLRIAQAALNNMLLVDDDVLPVSDLAVQRNIPEMKDSVDVTLAGFPGLAVYDTKMRMAEAQIQAERGKFLPEVSLLGSYNVYEEDSLASDLTPDWFVGVNVSIPLMDRSGRGGNLKAAKSLERKVDSLRRQARQDLALLVEKTYREATQALAEYDGLGTSLQLGEKTVILRNKAFQQGLATSLDVIDASLYVAAVKTQRSHAAYTSLVKLARLLALRGDIAANAFERKVNQEK